MIKIIKEGTRKVTTCQSCGCEFSYEEEDIIFSTSIFGTSIFDTSSIIKTINCPQCKSEIILSQTR